MSRKFFKLYISIFIFMPAILFIIFGWHDNFNQVKGKYIYLGLVVLFLASIVVYLASTRNTKLKPIIKININNSTFGMLLLFVGISFLICSILMKSKFGVSFRHTGPGLSAAGPIAVIFSIFKGAIAPVFILYSRLIMLDQELNWMHKLNSLCISAALFLFPIAAFDIVFLLLFFLFAIQPTRVMKIFTMKVGLVILIGTPVLISIILMGLATKVGFENLIDYLIDSGPSVLKYLQYRNGVFFFSSLVNFTSLDALFFNWNEGVETTINMLVYRVEVILGLTPDKLVIGNLNVLNFKNVYSNYDTSMEIGASPGLVLCFFYFMPFPISLIILYFYVLFISALLNHAYPKNEASYFLVFCILIAMFGLINNPIHVFTAIGPDIIKVCLLLFSLAITIPPSICLKNK